ncbi:TPA: hypothetical protein DCX15_06585 [bacterium]|nr:hypothetical protein [bacterium]
MKLYSPGLREYKDLADFTGSGTVLTYDEELQMKDGFVETSNPNSIQFLLNMGFKPVETIEEKVMNEEVKIEEEEIEAVEEKREYRKPERSLKLRGKIKKKAKRLGNSQHSRGWLR